MPISDLTRFRARLSYNEIQDHTGWKSSVMVNDYLGINAASAAIIAQVNTNEANIIANTANIAENSDNIEINFNAIVFNFQYLHGDSAYSLDYDDTSTAYAVGDLAVLEGNEYAANTAIAAPAGAFDPLKWDRVATTDNYNRIKAHESASSAHGSTGEIVGNLDFCTDLIGGVVLIMGLVEDAISSTAEVVLADVGVAPAAYAQAYTNSQADLINDVKAKHNEMLSDLNNAITQLNELLASSKASKQMSA